ncbi:2-polyprenylphenol 6-hydroxylase [Rhodospirillaceae bacterium]|nr:2-polyprenylphenol 6-hydroxylase [Rhodospirillaceae bacterium]
MGSHASIRRGVFKAMFRNLINFTRLLRILFQLLRYDVLYPIIWSKNLTFISWFVKIARIFRNRAYDNDRSGQRIASCLIKLGPSFIKFGQTLATRSDLIGEEIANDLSLLQDRLDPFSFDEAKATIETETGTQIYKLFSSFEEEPIAAASIAQVHYAVTMHGEEVAVKILRPRIEVSFAYDVALFIWIAEFLESHFSWTKRLRPVEVIKVFAETISFEMDLRMEAAAAAELAENFQDDPDFKVPTVFWATTTKRIFTLERLEGCRPNDLVSLQKAGLNPSEILQKSACIFFNQVFRDGFFHADMHPGNVFITKDGRIAPVDFGIMGRLDLETRFFLADMLTGFLTRDYRRVAEVHFNAGYVPSDQSVDLFAQACRSIGEPILELPLAEISLAKLLSQLFNITEKFEMETQPQLLLLQKTMLVAEGVGRQINDQVNIWELARPLIEAWMIENRSPPARIKKMTRDVIAFTERMPQILDKAELTINQLSTGQLKLDPNTIHQFTELQRKNKSRFLWPIILLFATSIIFVGLSI